MILYILSYDINIIFTYLSNIELLMSKNNQHKKDKIVALLKSHKY